MPLLFFLIFFFFVFFLFELILSSLMLPPLPLPKHPVTHPKALAQISSHSVHQPSFITEPRTTLGLGARLGTTHQWGWIWGPEVGALG